MKQRKPRKLGRRDASLTAIFAATLRNEKGVEWGQSGSENTIEETERNVVEKVGSGGGFSTPWIVLVNYLPHVSMCGRTIGPCCIESLFQRGGGGS